MSNNMIGELPYFNSAVDDWNVFTERLEQYFEINEIPERKQRALLLTSIGEPIYKILRDICHPTLPKNKPYDELCELLSKQFVIHTSVYRERQRFYSAYQMPNESISNWFARIKRLSVDCKFGDKYEMILLDRFMTGLQPSPILDRLYEEDENQTLKKMVDIAIAKESAMKMS